VFLLRLRKFKALALKLKSILLASKKYEFELQKAEAYLNELRKTFSQVKLKQEQSKKLYESNFEALISGMNAAKATVSSQLQATKALIELQNKTLNELEQKCLDANRIVKKIEKRLSILKVKELKFKKQKIWLQNYSH